MSVSLGIPYAAPTRTVTLRSPELGDGDTLDMGTTFKRTMSGAIYSYIRSPTKRKFTLFFRMLTRNKMEELITFVKLAYGADILYTDVDAATFKVRLNTNILNTPTNGTGRGIPGERNEDCQINLELEIVP